MIEGEKNKMMSSENYIDKTLRCVEQDCQEIFTWSADEQKFFKEKGLTHPPARCLDCRRKRRQLKN